MEGIIPFAVSFFFFLAWQDANKQVGMSGNIIVDQHAKLFRYFVKDHVNFNTMPIPRFPSRWWK